MSDKMLRMPADFPLTGRPIKKLLRNFLKIFPLMLPTDKSDLFLDMNKEFTEDYEKLEEYFNANPY